MIVSEATAAGSFGSEGLLVDKGRGRSVFLWISVLCFAVFFAGILGYAARQHEDRLPRQVLLEADRYTLTGRWSETAAYLESAMIHHGRHPLLLLRLGCVQSMQADTQEELLDKQVHFNQARASLLEAESLCPEETLIRWNLALLALRESMAYRKAGQQREEGRKLDEFLTRARDVQTERPWQPGVELHLGRLAQLKGDATAAQDHYIAEINSIPDRAAAIHALMQLRQEYRRSPPSLSRWYYVFATVVCSLIIMSGWAWGRHSHCLEKRDGRI